MFCDIFNSIALLFEGELKVGREIEGKPFKSRRRNMKIVEDKIENKTINLE